MTMKAQAHTHIFIYVLAIIIMSMVIAYGYSAIASFRQQADEVVYVKFKSELTKMVTKMGAEYKSVVKTELIVPTRYKKICFVDRNYLPPECIKDSGSYDETTCNAKYNLNINAQKVCDKHNTDEYEPIICNNWLNRDVRDNVFLIQDVKADAFFVDKIMITGKDPAIDKYLCFPVTSGKIQIKLQGEGDVTRISEW